MNVIGLLYPVKSLLPARRTELIESGRVFCEWLTEAGRDLGWVVYDYYANGYQPPEADIDALVVFGRPKNKTIRHPVTFRVANYDYNVQLLRDLVSICGGTHEDL